MDKKVYLLYNTKGFISIRSIEMLRLAIASAMIFANILSSASAGEQAAFVGDPSCDGLPTATTLDTFLTSHNILKKFVVEGEAALAITYGLVDTFSTILGVPSTITVYERPGDGSAQFAIFADEKGCSTVGGFVKLKTNIPPPPGVNI